jgi:hypothetical protein
VTRRVVGDIVRFSLTDNVWTNYIEGYQSIENKGFDFEGFNCVFVVIFQLGLGYHPLQL